MSLLLHCLAYFDLVFCINYVLIKYKTNIFKNELKNIWLQIIIFKLFSLNHEIFST